MVVSAIVWFLVKFSEKLLYENGRDWNIANTRGDKPSASSCDL